MIREGLESWLELGFVRKTLFSEINGELGLGWGLGLLTCIFSLFRSLLFFAASFLFCCLAIFSSILKAFFCWRLVIWASILLSTDYKWTFRCNLQPSYSQVIGEENRWGLNKIHMFHLICIVFFQYFRKMLLNQKIHFFQIQNKNII